MSEMKKVIPIDNNDTSYILIDAEGNEEDAIELDAAFIEEYNMTRRQYLEKIRAIEIAIRANNSTNFKG